MIKQIADAIKNQINGIVLYQEEMTELALTALFAGGHVLLEGVPGLAKTLWVRTLARVLDVEGKRVQFTADLMPSDIIGTKVFNQKTSDFELRKGPLFTQLFLADEINRTPPKTQSALLEVMEEHAVTIDGETHTLEEPFFVLATQNPIEYEGTYPLPEALTDRFMMKLKIDYPGIAAEKKILKMYHDGFTPKTSLTEIQSVCAGAEWAAARAALNNVRVEDGIYDYILSIVETTRRISTVRFGASPRGSVALLLASRAYAAIQGRDYVVPDDVRFLTLPVLRHRLLLTPETEIEGYTSDRILEGILSQVKVPR
jgi:MoxR-like ATPase